MRKEREGKVHLRLNKRTTFGTLADYYEANHLIPPVFEGDRQVGGMRSWEKQRRLLKLIRPFFDKKTLRSITYADLVRFKSTRLQTKTWRNDERSVATVNRELSMLQRVFQVALRNGWLAGDPFKMGKALISTADERARTRVLSRDEEARLLAQCTVDASICARSLFVLSTLVCSAAKYSK